MLIGGALHPRHPRPRRGATRWSGGTQGAPVPLVSARHGALQAPCPRLGPRPSALRPFGPPTYKPTCPLGLVEVGDGQRAAFPLARLTSRNFGDSVVVAGAVAHPLTISGPVLTATLRAREWVITTPFHDQHKSTDGFMSSIPLSKIGGCGQVLVTSPIPFAHASSAAITAAPPPPYSLRSHLVRDAPNADREVIKPTSLVPPKVGHPHHLSLLPSARG